MSSVCFWPHCWSRDLRAQNVGSYSSDDAGPYVNVLLPVRIGAFRGNNDTHNGFMLETMIDEAAHAAGTDPLAYRRRLFSKDARSVAVLDRAAAIADRGKVATGHHQGIAYLQPEFYRCRHAVIVEVSGTADALKVERLVGVCDSGLAINPLLAERAVEAEMIFFRGGGAAARSASRNGELLPADLDNVHPGWSPNGRSTLFTPGMKDRSFLQVFHLA